MLSLVVLAFFFISALVSGEFNIDLLVQHPGRRVPVKTIEGGGGPLLPFGVSGIFKALPFAIWFFLAIEEVPLAAEESMDPRRDVPRGTILAMHTLLIAAC